MPKILVADDNSNIQKMVANALKDQGIEVVGFSNGHSAIKKFPDVAPDMVLADVFMPVSDGYELCDWVKKSEKFNSVPVFLLVGAFDPLDEQRLAAVKADGVLKKPFVPPDNLIAAVKAMLGRVAQAKHAEMMERTHHDFASQVPHIEETQKLSQDEVRELLGEKPAAPPPPPSEPEPEMPEYAARTPQIQLGESSAPAFADMLGDAGEVEEQPSFRAAITEPEGPPEVPSYDIKEASKTPDPDLPPIKVDFSGPSEPMELVTDDHRAAAAPAAEHSRLEDLVSSAHDWAPPPPPPPVEPPPPPPPAAAPAPPAPPVLEMQMPPVPTISVEPEPPPPTSAPLGIPSKDLPGLEWSAPAVAAAPAAPAAPAVTIPVAAPVNPYVVDEVVDRIMMQLQPQIIHKITTEVGKALEFLQPKVLEQVQRDVIRPLAEELLRNATKK